MTTSKSQQSPVPKWEKDFYRESYYSYYDCGYNPSIFLKVQLGTAKLSKERIEIERLLHVTSLPA